MRGLVLSEEGLRTAGRIAAKTKARLLCDTLVPRIARGAGRAKVERIPYFPGAAAEFLRDIQSLILVGATPPVSLFASPETPSWLTPEGCEVLHLAHEHEDGLGALDGLAESIGAPREPSAVAELVLPDLAAGGALNPVSVARAVAHHLPENAIIVDESVSSGASLQPITSTTHPHDHLAVTGGSIGWALPAATGAAVACPGRRTVCLHGDGGAMMGMQALWTQAREKLAVTTVIFSNRSYNILNMEMARAGFDAVGPLGQSLFDLDRPSVDWVKLAEAMGVEATRAEDVDGFSDRFASAVRSAGPRLIEAVI
jgi:acetolactate synthase-1/2/3 large subunit